MKVTLAVFVLAFVYDNEIQVTALPKPNGIQHHLGSRTPYRFKSNKNDTRIKYPDCKDVKIWMIIRHGTRMPNNNDIWAAHNLTLFRNEILLQNKNVKGQLTEEQLQQLEDWTFKLDAEKENFLTMEGQDEMILLAERMQRRFPNAIKEKYNNKTFLFRHTATQRTHKSARYFTNGLFEKKHAQNVLFAPVTKVDKVLRFYKHCDRWQKQVKKNPDTYKEQDLYRISREMNETLESLSKRLGLDTVLTFDRANIIYKICGYETAWDKHRVSPWCYAFDENTVKTFEYYHDLKAYWVDGYGYDLTYRQACISIKHMFNTFSNTFEEGYTLHGQFMRPLKWAKDILSFKRKTEMKCMMGRNEEKPLSTFLFTHSGTILKILAYLGLYKPETHFRGTNIIEDRTWRVSDIDSFAANLAFVLFKCKSGDHILTLHQERIIRLPMCSEDLCPLKTLEDYFYDSIKHCDFDKMCTLAAQGDVTKDANKEMTENTTGTKP